MDNPIEQSPLFIKAKEIQRLVDTLVDVVYESELEYETEVEGAIIDESINYMAENAILIPEKIAEVFEDDMPYDARMENAILIRKAAREILTDSTSIESFGFKDFDYLDVLRKEIDEFRILFVEWVKTFDPWIYIIDRWGLFNPPGINYDDFDPDEDFPFKSLDDED